MLYYKRHLGDYAASTRHLSLLEHGVYNMLLDIYYINEAPLPPEEHAIYRLVGARSKDEREAVLTVLKEFFDLKEDGWHQSRCDEEIAKKQARSEINRDIGRRGGRPQKTESVSEKNRNGYKVENESVSEKNPSHKPLTNSHTSPSGDVPPLPPRATRPLPDWMPAEEWAAFIEHRKRMRAPMSNLAQARAIAELDRLRGDGYDPVAVINQSIINGWKGLFPIRDSQRQPQPQRRSIHDERAATIAALTGRSRRQDDTGRIIDITAVANVVD